MSEVRSMKGMLVEQNHGGTGKQVAVQLLLLKHYVKVQDSKKRSGKCREWLVL